MNPSATLERAHELGRATFPGFCSVVRPHYRPFPHQAPLAALIEDILHGRVTRAIVSEPPRHGKSYTLAETGPAYVYGNEPRLKFMQGAYGADLAQDFGRSVRTIMQSPLYRALFGFGVSPYVTAADHFDTERGGKYLSGGVNSPFTGWGANWFHIDDPIKTRREAESQTYRKQVTDWLQGVVYDRLEDFDDGRSNILTVCATRWHIEDLSGWLRKHMADEGWVFISLPAVVDRHGVRCDPEDPGAIPLFPEKYSLERYARIKAAVGSYEWDSKWQQNPTPLKGGIINLDWFRRYTTLPRVAYKVHSWDTAQKTELTSAYSVCGSWHTAAGRHYLVDVYREKLQYPDLKRTVISLAENDHPDEVMIEDKASGIQLIQDLRQNTRLPIIAVEPEADKLTRAFGQSALIESGLVFLPETASWLPDFESEIRAFPAGDFADQVDQMTQYLARHRNRADGFAFASTGSRASAGVSTSGGGFARTG